MFRFIESIKYKNGKLQNLPFHNDRFRKTRGAFFSIYDDAKLEELITLPSSHDNTSLQKCRIIYGKTIHKIEFIPYTIKQISSLKIVNADYALYSYKYADRSELEHLFRKRKECDDILIVKNKLVTDSSYANILFLDGKKWITPSAPLLKGTQREYLIHKGIIREKNIAVSDISRFKKFKLINALRSFDEAPEIDIANIKP